MNNETLMALVGILGLLLLLSRLSAHWEQRQTIKDLKEDRDQAKSELESERERFKSELEAERQKSEDLMSKLFEANNLTAILISEGGNKYGSFERNRIVQNVKARLHGTMNPMMLIAEGHLGKALDVLLGVAEDDDCQTIIGMKAQLKQASKQSDKGIISPDEFSRIVNRVRDATLGMCVNYYPNPPPQD